MKKESQLNIKMPEGIPLLSSSLNRLIEIEGNDELSTHDLSAIILDDYGLINKVLQTVNAFYYNRVGREINTVTHAVILLGFNTIKKIALSMAVLELLENDQGEKAVTEIGKAFLSAHLAREIGLGLKDIEPEEIFISTLFRHLARIVLAIGDPDLLSEVERLEKSSKQKDRLKAKSIIRSLGYQLTDLWNLPKSLSVYLEGYSSKFPGQFAPHRAMARDISIFVNLWQKGGVQDNITAARDRLLKNYSLGPNELESKLRKAIKETKKSLPKFDRVIEKKDQGLDQKGETPALPKEDMAPEKVRSHLEREILFTGLIQNLMGMVNDLDVGLEQVYLLAIEILRRVIDISNIIFCKVSPEREVFSASFGMGDKASLLKKQLCFGLNNSPKGLKTAFSMEKEALFSWADLLPARNGIPEKLLKRAVLLAPLVIEKRHIGCLILDKHSGDMFEPGEIQKTSIVRQLVVTATSLRARRRLQA